MQILIRNAEGNLTVEDREYAAEKLGRLDRYFNQASRVEIVHREQKLIHRIEVTVFADGLTVRGEESDNNIRAAIDLVGDKIEGRLRKLKSKLVDRHKKKGTHLPEGFDEPQESAEPVFKIAERKRFLLKPLLPEDAAVEMELVDHPFYVFKNQNNDRIEVLYKRKNGTYGLLEPEV